jgi:catechol 2,3-dioxygenase-like lactoylglutathione lyase family enzyme
MNPASLTPAGGRRWRAQAGLLLLLLASGTGFAAVTAVGPIILSVADRDRQVAFYTNTLSFTWAGETTESGAEFERLTGLAGARARTARLRLGEETILLSEFVTPRGRPVPADARSTDHAFQHIAIVVRDMDRAYAHLRRHGVRHVSTGPQTLPAWNPAAGGIRAFYFRDPEDHVLEVIWFPPGKGDPRWQRPGTNLFLGLDHTAIVVADTERSLAFYRDSLGLRVAGESENWGVEQEHLNQVFGARLRITALRAPAGPGLELLEYLAPPGGRPRPADTRVNDLLAWRTVLIAEADPAAPRLAADPDGHLLEFRP